MLGVDRGDEVARVEPISGMLPELNAEVKSTRRRYELAATPLTWPAATVKCFEVRVEVMTDGTMSFGRLVRALAIDLASEVLPTPGGTTKHMILQIGRAHV